MAVRYLLIQFLINATGCFCVICLIGGQFQIKTTGLAGRLHLRHRIIAGKARKCLMNFMPYAYVLRCPNGL